MLKAKMLSLFRALVLNPEQFDQQKKKDANKPSSDQGLLMNKKLFFWKAAMAF